MKKISGVIALAVTATALLTTLTSCSGKKKLETERNLQKRK